jgi:photosystem II stability/assembly factor-like uncharacterized protein
MKIYHSLIAGLALATGFSGALVQAAVVKSAIERPALPSAKASRSLLIDVARAGQRLVAVGDRGHIVFSDDQGKTWLQAKVPVSVMLTAVSFPNAQEGWAVGHQGVILYTSDAGATWQLQHANADSNGEKAGTPLLGVWFADNQNGYAVGAYGLFLVTHDGGTTWSDDSSAIHNPDGWHLNAIHGLEGTSTVFIVGEHGMLFRSTDKGATWSSLASPFDGSFFGISPIAPDLVLLYGLQGRLYVSTNQGQQWRQVQTGVTSGLNTAARLEDGRIVVAGNAGVLLVAADSGLNLISETRSDRQSITALLPLSGSGLLTVGDGGVKSLPAAGK